MIRDALPWIMSSMTIAVMWLAGSKNIWAWRLSLLNQALWATWIINTGTWGLLPLTAAMVFVGVRNLLKWSVALSAAETEGV
jgi:hypothetical protein